MTIYKIDGIETNDIHVKKLRALLHILQADVAKGTIKPAMALATLHLLADTLTRKKVRNENRPGSAGSHRHVSRRRRS